MPTRPGVNGGLMRRQHADHPPVNYISVESDYTVREGARVPSAWHRMGAILAGRESPGSSGRSKG